MIVLVIKWQIFGVIVSSACTYGIEIILLWYYLKEDYVMKFNAFKLMIGPLLLFLMIVLIEPSVPVQYLSVVHVAYGLVCAVLLWFAYRNELKLITPSKIFK
jgi:O-antigen/teichoic acid export membrane protein